jgi:hypothetical protein
MIKVGNVKESIQKKDKKSGKMKKVEILYSYKDVHYDIDGWADSNLFLPDDYDLVYMKIEGKKIMPGWISATSWNGLRLKPEGKVVYWKRKLEEKD